MPKRARHIKMDIKERPREISYSILLSELYAGFELLKNIKHVPLYIKEKLQKLYDNSPYYSICQVRRFSAI